MLEKVAAMELLLVGIHAIKKAVKLGCENYYDQFSPDELSDTEYQVYRRGLAQLADGIPPGCVDFVISKG